MDIFSRPDYYPSPSSNVVKYREPDGFKGKRTILNADLVALVVDLSSPVDAVDYTVISDFFLIYRNFMSPMQLQHLLVMRFRWCISEIEVETSKTNRRRKIGEIALVRTFVLLRHWILNYFVQDFLVDVNLRIQLIKFLNRKLKTYPKIVRCTVLNLKKAWIHCSKRVWTNLDLDEPKIIGEDDLWVKYEIKDITELEELKKRNSQLSSYAIQGSSSPNFRNQSVLSLYKSTDVFQLPVPSAAERRKKDNRTASMILFPQDNSNVKVIDTRKPLNAWSAADSKAEHEGNGLKGHNKISRLSKLTKVSTVMKDIDYPSSPGINKVMPPTPAKKVELILQLPDDNKNNSTNSTLPFSRNGSVRRSSSLGRISSVGRSSNSRNINTIGRSASTGRAGSVSRSSNFRSSMMHHGAVGLMSKWKKNHTYANRHDNEASLKKKNDNIKPEMENFIKYVISISSLEDRNFAPEEMENLISTKFDLLSARTIEEVEYLVTLENNLIKEVNQTVTEDEKPPIVQETEKEKQVSDEMEFSAMDNLNIYQTVNTIANSVFSLSKALNQHKQQQIQPQNIVASPSFAVLERRQVQSAMPFAGAHSHSRLSMNSQNIEKECTPSFRDNGPQRLIFHGSSIQRDPTKEKDAHRFSDTSSSMTPTKLRRSPSPKRTCPSPSKQPLPDVQECHDLSSDGVHNDNASTLSCVSYDSKLSNPENLPIGTGRRSRKVSLTYPNQDHSLKRKDAQPNLREFTFEDKERLEKEDTRSLDSFVTTNEPESDGSEKASFHEASEFTATIVRQSSGRVSLSGGRTRIYSNARESMWSAGQRVSQDPDFLSKDKALHEKEIEMLELENDMTKRMSTTTSVDTNMLFSSTHGSPRKSSFLPPGPIRLSATPSIHSVASVQRNSTDDILKTQDIPKRHEPIDSTPKSKGKNILQPQSSTDSSFNFSTSNDGCSQNDFGMAAGLGSKYLFAPDNESTDYASPAKNVEALKNKFFEDDNEDTFELESKQGDDESPIKGPVVGGSSHKNLEGKSHNVERLLEKIDDKQKQMPKFGTPDTPTTIDWNNFSEDSVVDDPVNVALMKLEGTYKNDGSEENGPSSHKSSDSVLVNEVSMLGISDVAGGQPDPKNKRKSLLIETRRQTIMNIPYTPTAAEQGSLGSQESITFQAKDLLAQYEMKDPSLSLENCEQHIPFILMYDSLSIAQQMTLIEKELLSEVDWKDLVNVDLNYSGPPITSWLQLLVQNESMSGINLAIARFNLTVDWIISEIILTADIKLKRNTIQRFIHVADHCKSFQNYNTLMEIVLALNSTAVQTFVEAWRLIEPGDLITWGELKKMPSLDKNYAYIRKLLNNIDPMKGCAPFIVVYLSDLSLNSEKRTWIKDNEIVNYNKFETNVQIVKNFIQRVQWSKFYDFRVDHELLSKCVYLTALSHTEMTQVINRSTNNK